MKELAIKYGCNPHQKPSRIFMKEGELPVSVLNGAPSFINFCDGLNAWQLVRELEEATGLPAAASFKHVSPAGAAVAVPLNDALKQAYRVVGKELSPVAIAYVRARGADRVSSFGDFVAVSGTVDVSMASLLKNEVSDGIIAPAYEPEALDLLKAKKKGGYVVLQIDPTYNPAPIEAKDIFGVTLEQLRNEVKITPATFANVVTADKHFPEEAIRDMQIATITLKYTQSNSICFAFDGQVIGVGAGQQSRIHCTRLAAQKADIWFLRQHPKVLALPFKAGLGNPVKDNAIDLYLRDDITDMEYKVWMEMFDTAPVMLTKEEKKAWIAGFTGVTFGSDAFIPFRDNIDRAASVGTKYIAQCGGSIRDVDVIGAADEYGMVMSFTGLRLFHH